VTGSLIAIEGIDGAGTTTQARLLVEWMNGHGLPAHHTWEPSQGPIGLLLREILRGQLERPIDLGAIALLFAADRLDHLAQEIRPRLEAGVHVVSDRYVYSSLAYQSLDHKLDWVATLNERAPEPDLTIYVRVPAELARERRQTRGAARELFEQDELQARIAARYDEILGSSVTSGAWLLDPSLDPGQDPAWIRRDPRPTAVPCGRQPATAVVDGSVPVDVLQRRLRALVEKVARREGS